VQAEAAEDIDQIWSNCMAYNMDGSDFYKLANKFKQRFENDFSKVSDVGGRVFYGGDISTSSDCRLVAQQVFHSGRGRLNLAVGKALLVATTCCLILSVSRPSYRLCGLSQIKGDDAGGGGGGGEDSNVDLDRPPTLEEQTQFAHNIYMIKSEELGEVRGHMSATPATPAPPGTRRHSKAS
jgi:hypothetical protein